MRMSLFSVTKVANETMNFPFDVKPLIVITFVSGELSMNMKTKRKIGFAIACFMMLVFVQTAFASGLYFQTNDIVNMRSSPSTSAAVMQTVNLNTLVEMLEHDPVGWSKVRLNGVEGYIKSDFLTMPTGIGSMTFVTIDGVNFRAGPSTDEIIISSLLTGTSIEVLEHDPTGWSRARVAGTTGYLRSEYIALPLQSTQQSSTTTTETNQILKTNDGVNFRSGPSIDSPIIRTINVNTEVSVLERNQGGWSRVLYEGTVGYIRADLLSVNGLYVELLEWSVVRQLIRYGDPIRCYDVRTGSTFYIKCFSKGDHADVEPSTRNDTEAILRTHNGTWSWSARPLWVTIGDRTVAASMHGMPHDVSTIADNGMNGHLCLHFLGSTTSSTSASYRADLQNAVTEAWNAR